MNLTAEQLWARFQKYCTEFPEIGLTLDLSRMNFSEAFLESMQPALERAFDAMEALEAGAIANPDEQRMVGHYWLRNPALAPNNEIRQSIETTHQRIIDFTRQIHAGAIQGAHGPFKHLLLIGIGGSALGPQFVSHALSHPAHDKMSISFFDNTDPDGMDKVLATLTGKLGQTLCIVISKSGGTKETRNGMLEAKEAFSHSGLKFSDHAVAVTGTGSELFQTAKDERWIEIFPMWDWVGGRTSELSAVGLLPASLQGFDIESLISGASVCDRVTRARSFRENPAAQMALMWFYAGDGKGTKDMIILPYKDRLELFSKYLQQLIMESLGKAMNLRDEKVEQGIAVYGNKGSTDQHAYVQQLRDGLPHFFVTFIEVLKDRGSASVEVEPGITTGDYLQGFLLGTRQALFENGRESMTITIQDTSAFSIGVLIALYERAVGLYASLIEVNAYHQPGVEAGKKAATAILKNQLMIIDFLSAHRGEWHSLDEIVSGASTPPEVTLKICEHLASNPTRGIRKRSAKDRFKTEFQLS